LIVDDSAFMRMVLKDIIDQQPDMKVVGFAKGWSRSNRQNYYIKT